MRKIVLGVLTLGGFGAVFAVWYSASEPSRRYERLLAWAATPGDPSREEVEETLRWFLDRRPEDLVDRIRRSILEDRELEAASTILHRTDRRFRGRGQFERRPYDARVRREQAAERLVERVLESPEVVRALAGSPSVAVRLRLVEMFPYGDRRVVREVALGFAERDPDRLVRIRALGLLESGSRRGIFSIGDLIERLSRDPDVGVRLAALSLLAQYFGNAQAGRELLIGRLQECVSSTSSEGYDLLWNAPSSMFEPRHIGHEVRGALGGWVFCDSGLIWELAERYGDVLERRSVGEFEN